MECGSNALFNNSYCEYTIKDIYINFNIVYVGVRNRFGKFYGYTFMEILACWGSLYESWLTPTYGI